MQFAYRLNRSVDNAVNIFKHLDSPGIYARILFVELSSAMYCLGSISLIPRPSTTDPPKDAFFPPLLFYLYINTSKSSHLSVKLLKFADDPTLIGLISDESSYRWDIKYPVIWWSMNNLESPVPLTPFPLCHWVCHQPGPQGGERQVFHKKVTVKVILYLLSQLNTFIQQKKTMVHFYSAITEFILTSSITVW